MLLKNKKIGFALTDSFYTFEKTILQIEKLVKEGAYVIPIMLETNYINIKTKFGNLQDFKEKIEKITKRKIIYTQNDIELPENESDILVIAPCSGNIIAKFANGISDTSVLTAAKIISKTEKNIVIGIATNDGLSGNAENIGKLLNRKCVFFIPFRQDNPITKPFSLCYEPKYIVKTIEQALENEQIQPILL